MVRYQAWQFVHPDLDPVETGGSGLQLASTGAISMIGEEASVRQAILLLLSTLPGERVMRPEYGCELRKLVFALNDDTTAGLAIHFVQQAIERWEPRVEIMHLDSVRTPEQPSALVIDLRYRIRASFQTGQLTLALNLAE